MSTLNEALFQAKADLVNGGVSFLTFVNRQLSSVEPGETDEAKEMQRILAERISTAMLAFAENLKRVNSQGYEYLLIMPSAQPAKAELCTDDTLMTYCPALKDKYYEEYKTLLAAVESAQDTLVKLYEKDGEQYASIKLWFERIAIAFFVLITLAYTAILGPVAGLITLGLCATLWLGATASWSCLSYQTQFNTLHSPIQEVIPAQELNEYCRANRFFPAKAASTPVVEEAVCPDNESTETAQPM